MGKVCSVMRSALVCCALLLTALCAKAVPFVVNGVWYEALDDKTCQVVRMPEDTMLYSGTIVVPSHVGEGNLKVTGIAAGAFAGSVKLKAVKLPKTLRVVGPEAFSGCTRLTSLRLPRGVEEIGTLAFAGCTSLATLAVGDQLSSVGSKAFAKCEVLTDIKVFGQAEPEALRKQVPRGVTVMLVE